MPARPSRLRSELLALVVIVVAVAACARAPGEREVLLESIDRAHDAVAGGAGDARAGRAAVEALRSLRVGEELEPTRDRCAELYAALLEHEERSAEVTALLDRYERVPRAEWPPDVAGRMRSAYAAARAATTSAEDARPSCERLRASLRGDVVTGAR